MSTYNQQYTEDDTAQNPGDTETEIANSQPSKPPDSTEASEGNLEQYLSGWKRALADYENLKNETAAKLGSLKSVVSASLVYELLPMIDTLEYILNNTPEEEQKSVWYKGIEQSHKQWQSFMEQQGIAHIQSLGEPFNPEQHEALQMEQDDTKADDEILKELRKGYLIDQTVLRPAQVIVNKKVSKH